MLQYYSAGNIAAQAFLDVLELIVPKLQFQESINPLLESTTYQADLRDK